MSKRIPHPSAVAAANGILSLASKGRLKLDKAARLIDRATRLGQVQHDAEYLYKKLMRVSGCDPVATAFWSKSIANRKRGSR